MTKDEINNLKDKVKIHGDNYTLQANGYSRKLTIADLEKAGLLPKYTVPIENTTIHISPIYNVGKRLAVIGYVKKEDSNEYVARSYYLSRSQGIWRYLPGYTHDWYDKGYSEVSITAPISLQFALIGIQEKQKQPIFVENPHFYFAGTARRTPVGKIPVDTGSRTYNWEVEGIPYRLQGNFSAKAADEVFPGEVTKVPLDEVMFGKTEKITFKGTEGVTKVRPEAISFDNDQDKPDFSHLIASTQQDTELYGPITIDVYASKNEELQYMFCRDQHKRAWIGGIEVTKENKIQSVGLRQRWVDAGDLTTPAYEYYEQAGGYANYKDQNGPYVDMFENYLKNIPVIQEYLNHINGDHSKNDGL